MQAMLAGRIKDVSTLKYPVLASMKLDGIRAFVYQGTLMSRKFKPIPNKYVQELFGGLPEGFDGELILGEPTAPDCMRKTTSAVMSDSHETGKDVTFYVFDRMGNEYGFNTRITQVLDYVNKFHYPQVMPVCQYVIENTEELLALESKALAAGHEGLMVRSPNGPYKHGRSTEREGILLKLKRFEDSEALVIGYEELQHNGNEATKDELGHTKRSTSKDGKVGLGTFGKFIARDCKTGVEFDCGTGKGLTKELRASLWSERNTLVGRTMKYKYFPTGSKDRPRFPIWLGWRDPRDMD